MVFLFIPNIIGYFRFLFAFMAIFTYLDHPIITIVLLSVSEILDAFDGMAARKFNQSTNFGAVLDMVCDRATDAMILAMLGALYPQFAFIFYGDIILDLTSHWFQMYASVSSGEHHKKIVNRFKLLDIYYTNKLVLFMLCAGNGLFMGICYFIYFEESLGVSPGVVMFDRAFLFVTAILFAIKKLMSVLQLISASYKIAEVDIKRIKGE